MNTDTIRVHLCSSVAALGLQVGDGFINERIERARGDIGLPPRSLDSTLL